MAVNVRPTIYDNNPITVNLTNSSDVLIRYHSNAYYSINATPSSGATVQHVAAWTGTEGQPRANELRTSTGTFYEVDTGNFGFAAFDTSQSHIEKYVTKTLVPYVHLTVGVVTDNPSVDGVMNITIRGSCYNDQFGSSGLTNRLTLKYRYGTRYGTMSEWFTVSPSFDNYRYRYTTSVTGLDYQTSYVVEVYAEDYLEGPIVVESDPVSSQPVFDWSSSDFNFNVPVNFGDDITSNGALDVIGYVDIHNPETGLRFNGVSMPIEVGTWSPYMEGLNASSRSGSYLRLGNKCVISWYLTGTTTEYVSIPYISGVPFTPTHGRWYAGGGAFSGGTLDANNAFCGWVLDGRLASASDRNIYPRSVPVSSSQANQGLNYVRFNSSGQTIYCSGTLMYDIED